MKVAERVLDVDSTLTGERVQMGIDQNALAHIMSVLTDLYSDPEMAVIREYSTNAFDAHVQDNVTRPIEVTLPTPLAPFFRVRDYGEGLDAEDIRLIYSQYGASTKRESNDVVGMLGLGCKSALTYTDQFTLVGVKNGVCVQISVSRDEDGAGSMTIVDQYKTDEPSGVEVVIPVKGGHNFETKSADFFKFWKPGTVLVNGVEPKQIDGIWLTDKIVLASELNRDYIVMGNVAYPYGNEVNYNYYQNYTATFVEIGAVNFTPSREDLQMTKQTKETIERVRATVKGEIQAAFKREIEACTDRPSALKTYQNVVSRGYTGNAVWHDEQIPQRFSSDDPKKPYHFHTLNMEYRSKGRLETILPTQNANGIYAFFYGFKDAALSPYKKRKISQWAVENNISSPRVWVAMDRIPADVRKWIDPSRIYNWQAVADTKLPQNPKTQSGRVSGSYEIIVGDPNYVIASFLNSSGQKTTNKEFRHYTKFGVPATDLDTSKPLYYIESRLYEPNRYLPLLDMVHKKMGYTLVPLGLNRIKKFERDFPNAVKVTEAFNKLTENWQDSLTDEDKIVLAIEAEGYYLVNRLKSMDENKVDDPELKTAIELIKNNKKNSNTEIYNTYRTFTTFEAKWNNPLDKYPLASDVYNRYNEKEMNHVYLYINAVYSAEKGVK